MFSRLQRSYVGHRRYGELQRGAKMDYSDYIINTGKGGRPCPQGKILVTVREGKRNTTQLNKQNNNAKDRHTGKKKESNDDDFSFLICCRQLWMIKTKPLIIIWEIKIFAKEKSLLPKSKNLVKKKDAYIYPAVGQTTFLVDENDDDDQIPSYYPYLLHRFRIALPNSNSRSSSSRHSNNIIVVTIWGIYYISHGSSGIFFFFFLICVVTKKYARTAKGR